MVPQQSRYPANRMFLDLKKAALTSALALLPCALALAMSYKQRLSHLVLSSITCASGVAGLSPTVQ